MADVLQRLAFFVSFAGLVLLVRGCGEYRTSSRAGSTATSMTCSELFERGPGENARVSLARCRVCAQAGVVEIPRGVEEMFWVPAVPDGLPCAATALGRASSGDGLLVPEELQARLVVKLEKIAWEAGGSEIGSGAPLQGLLLDSLAGLPGDVKAGLYGPTYTVTGRVPEGWILELGRTPQGRLSALGQMGAGLGLVLIGLFASTLRSSDESATPVEVEGES